MRITKTIRTFLAAGLCSAVGIVAHADQVTFNVNMSAITNSLGAPAYTEVRASGAFNGWSQSGVLTNSGGNIYTNTFEVAANGNYKYTCVVNGGVSWEAGADHPITLTGSPQTLPLLNFNYDGPTPIDFVTNNITFQVDMRVQGVSWQNGGGIIRVSGGFNGWGNGGDLIAVSSSPADYPTNWWYTNTFQAITQLMPPSATPGQKINRYKFRANGGWEEPVTINANGSNDRFWDATTTGDRVLPLVFYSDASLCDVLDHDMDITYVLHLTNGTFTTTGHAFDNTQDTVHINGEALLGVWQPWDTGLPQLIRNGSSDYYTNTFTVPAGRPLNQKVKYGIGFVGNTNSVDNEAPQFADHIQWIRSTNTTYTMAPVEFGTNYASTRVQIQYGNLKAGAPSGGNVPVTWDGCPCVTLQSSPSLSSGSWTDLPETESASSKNVPNTGSQFFRLQKRPTP